MKKIALVAMLGLCGATTTVHADSLTGDFNVLITLTAGCAIVAPAAMNFTYIGMQDSASTASTDFHMACTKGLPYKLGLLTATGGVGLTASFTDTTTQLIYSLELGTGMQAGTGTGIDETKTISGTIAANQAGNCPTGTSGTYIGGHTVTPSGTYTNNTFQCNNGTTGNPHTVGVFF